MSVEAHILAFRQIVQGYSISKSPLLLVRAMYIILKRRQFFLFNVCIY